MPLWGFQDGELGEEGGRCVFDRRPPPQPPPRGNMLRYGYNYGYGHGYGHGDGCDYGYGYATATLLLRRQHSRVATTATATATLWYVRSTLWPRLRPRYGHATATPRRGRGIRASGCATATTMAALLPQLRPR